MVAIAACACTTPPAVAPVVVAPRVVVAPPSVPAPRCRAELAAAAVAGDPLAAYLDAVSLAAPRRRGGTCEPARSNLDRAAQAILTGAHGAPAGHAAWNHRTAPRGLGQVARRFALGPAQHARLDRIGFVVLPAPRFASYAQAFHEVYQSQLPLYVSIDAVLHALYAGHARIVGDLERVGLSPRLERALAAMACAAASAGDRDADLAIATARSLLAGTIVSPTLGDPAEVRRRVAAAPAARPYPRARASLRAAGLDGVALGTLARRADVTALLAALEADEAALGTPPPTTAASAAELAIVLGHAPDPRAGDLAIDPGRRAALTEEGRAAAGGLTGAWWAAIGALASRPAGTVPSFMRSAAFADLRMGSAVAAFAQLASAAPPPPGEPYDQAGCEIPDAWVEPAPAVYQALLAYVAHGAELAARLDPGRATASAATLARIERTLRVLQSIAADELAGRAVSEVERRYLAMVVEMAPGDTGVPPSFTGWYFDLFADPGGALAEAALATRLGRGGLEVTVDAPGLGLFVVDAGGPPRLMVGPVAGARVGGAAPWAQGYLAAAPEAPPVAIRVTADETLGIEVAVLADVDLGRVTIEVLDHHRRRLSARSRVISRGTTIVPFPRRHLAPDVELVHLEIGGFHGWVEVGWNGGAGRFGAGPDPFAHP